MYPKLFEIPFVNLPVWSYGLMLVIGFICAVAVIRHLSRGIAPDPEMITNAALYALIAGLLGARLFYVIHYWDRFRTDLFGIVAVWRGGLELLGGVTLAIFVIVVYLRYHKLPVRRYLDILAIGLLLALGFGRIGCFLRGCCFGKPTSLPWAVRFPYGSDSYLSQINPDPQRNRPEPYLNLPDEFFEYQYGRTAHSRTLKPYEKLTEAQKNLVRQGPCRALPVHPTQLYSAANAAVCSFILYLFWRRSRKMHKQGKTKALFTKAGSTFALMFIIYGVTRFLLEFLRDDNPFEIGTLTISQLIAVALVILGLVLMAAFEKLPAGKDGDND